MNHAVFGAALSATMFAAFAAHGQQCASCNQHSGCGPNASYYQSYYRGSCEEAYYQNSIWPRQYISPARRGICQAFSVMTHNGWRRQNLLGPYHFEADGVQLNEAGRLKAQWILTQAPTAHRTIYVQQVADQKQTVGRVEAVEQFVSNHGGMGGPADVQETFIRDDGYPASMVDAIFTGFKANQPVPALPPDGALESSN